MSYIEQKVAGCSSCTLYLVRLCYGRSFWFPLFREPLVLGMKLLGRLHGIDYAAVDGPDKDCKGCLRHLKNRLKERSPLFVFLNGLVNPVFNRLRDSQLSKEDKATAKEFAAGKCPSLMPLPWPLAIFVTFRGRSCRAILSRWSPMRRITAFLPDTLYSAPPFPR